MKLLSKKDGRAMRVLHLTHIDSDAVGCALVWRFYMDYSFGKENKDYILTERFCGNGELIDREVEKYLGLTDNEDDYYDIICISDNSVSPQVCEKIDSYGRKWGSYLYGFDHHRTNHLYEDYPWFVVKETDERTGRLRAACLLMYDILSIGDNDFHDFCEGIKQVVKDISEYDTWNWKQLPLKNARYGNNVHAFMTKDGYVDPSNKRAFLPGDFHKITKFLYDEDIVAVVSKKIGIIPMTNLLYSYLTRDIEKLVKKGRHDFKFNPIRLYYPMSVVTMYYSALMEEARMVEASKRNIKMISFMDAIPMDKDSLSSELAQEAEKYADLKIATWIGDTNPFNSAISENTLDQPGVDMTMSVIVNGQRVELRTKRDDIDLGGIAKKFFNGGGHPKAAGGKYYDDAIYKYLVEFRKAPLVFASNNE